MIFIKTNSFDFNFIQSFQYYNKTIIYYLKELFINKF
jgi:hypothetical protein